MSTTRRRPTHSSTRSLTGSSIIVGSAPFVSTMILYGPGLTVGTLNFSSFSDWLVTSPSCSCRQPQDTPRPRILFPDCHRKPQPRCQPLRCTVRPSASSAWRAISGRLPTNASSETRTIERTDRNHMVASRTIHTTPKCRLCAGTLESAGIGRKNAIHPAGNMI